MKVTTLFARIRRLMQPPHFADQEKSRVASLLNTILWGMLGAETFRAFVFLFLPGLALHISLAATLVVCLTAGLLLWMLHAGYVKIASLLLLIAFWLPMVVLTAFYGGIRGPIYVFLIEVIIVAGLLLGSAGAIAFAVVSLLVGLLLFFGELTGVISPSTNVLRLEIFFAAIGQVFLVVPLLVTLYHRSFIRALRRARENERVLVATNQELETIRDSLEEEVAERTRSAEEARERAERTNRAYQAQVWQMQGLAQLSDVRDAGGITALSHHILEHLCRYVGVQAGVFYLADEEALTPVAHFATRATPEYDGHFAIGEGVVGQVARDRQPYLLHSEASPLFVRSSFGDIALHHVIFHPLLAEKALIGVLELGRLTPYTEAERQFIAQAAERVAIVLKGTQASLRVSTLLEETQAQTEELQAQEEELRAANEELQAQAERLRAANEELRAQAERLQAAEELRSRERQDV